MAYSFINPYNFIPLGNGSKQVEKIKNDSNLSGVIFYSLLTKTPLFIPNTSNDDAFDMEKKVKDHKSYDFFSYKDLSSMKGKGSVKNELPLPVIPGSEMRGMLRSYYEILTNSCMSAVDDEKILSKRTPQRFEPKLLERIKNEDTVEYILHNAEICQAKVEKLEKNETKKWLPGTKVTLAYTESDTAKPFVNILNNTNIRPEQSFDGYIMKRKKEAILHIFHKKGTNINGKNKEIIKFSEDDLNKKLKTTIEIYLTNSDEPFYKQYKEAYEKFIKGTGEKYFPVYLGEIDYGINRVKSYMLSPSCMTRDVYDIKISDMARYYRSCEKTGSLCPACSLFGTLGKNNKAISSRIRVADLECTEHDTKKCFDTEPVTLQILSNPKFNPEFYLKRPNEKAVFWTYEYYICEKDLYENDLKKVHVHKNTAGINGRKFYWHHPDFSLENCKGEASNLNKTVRPVKPQITFQGKIYFNNISKEELNTLCYLINAGEAFDIDLEDRKHGYKLGAAKPLGLGSVAMHVDRILLRTFTIDENQGITMVEEPYIPDMKHTLVDSGITQNFAIMTEFDYLKKYMQSGEKVISYPRTKKDGNIFDWFSENHTGYNRKRKIDQRMPNSRMNMLFKEYLEPMNPETREIEFTKKIIGNKSNRQKNNSYNANNNRKDDNKKSHTNNKGNRNNVRKKR